jgi:hypothetical protein
MHKSYLAIILLLLIAIFLARDFLSKIGFGILSMLNVSIKEKIGGKLLLAYQPSIEIGNQQNIYTEFINTGTSQVTEKIEVKVYGYVNGTLKPLAYYFDATVPVAVGMRRGFKTVFVPPEKGLYYIQAKASYDTKVVEVWGAFSVYYPPVQVIPVYVPVQAPPAVAPSPTIVGAPELTLEYPELVKFYVGEKKLLNINIKNVGTASAHNLKLYISTSSLIDISIYPKQVSALNPNESLTFVVSIGIPPTMQEGIYPLEFETMNDEGIKKTGEISLQVSLIPPPEEEEISQKILNYEFLVSEIQQQINSAFLQGYDVGLANKTLSLARISLENAKDYLKSKKIKDAKMELENVESKIQDAALQLASAMLYLYKPPAILWWLILLIILLMALVLLAYWYWRKRMKRRPKLLQKMEETEK